MTPSYVFFDRQLVNEASEGSGWAAALLLGVSFGGDANGFARMCDCDARDRSSVSGGLHAAEERGDADMVSLSLRVRADFDVRNERGNTPLLLACRAGNMEIAMVFLGEGSDPFLANMLGDTPLLLTCRAGDMEFAKMLLGKMVENEQQQEGEHASAATLAQTG